MRCGKRMRLFWARDGDYLERIHVDSSPPVRSYRQANVWLDGLMDRFEASRPDGFVPLIEWDE